MFRNLATLFKYRGLIQSLVVRELKARYRGSLLGFFWSFVNPLLLLLIYTFVFTVVLPGTRPVDIEPYALFMFTGILPWTWFSSSLLESSNVLISSGNLIKKVLFPAEVLPIVTALANMVHFFLGLPILAIFLLYYGVPLQFSELVWFPLVVFVQLLLIISIGLLVSALTVHFRDVKDLLSNLRDVLVLRDADHLPDVGRARRRSVAAQPEPVHAPRHLVPGDPVLRGPLRALEVAAGAARGLGRAVPLRLLRLRSPARFVRGGRVIRAEPRAGSHA
jgi:ABC-type polysaccharide/polyol phosphate export permease